jgi:hypothetical protein
MSNDVEPLSAADGYKQALLTCMDPRIDVNTVLERLSNEWQDWKPGKDSTYVVRNAGGVATDDAVRSLVMVQRLAAAPEVSFVLIAVVAHEATTDKPCAMTTMSDDAMNARIEADSGVGMTPPFPLEFFKAAELDEPPQLVAHEPRRSSHRHPSQLDDGCRRSSSSMRRTLLSESSS